MKLGVGPCACIVWKSCSARSHSPPFSPALMSELYVITSGVSQCDCIVSKSCAARSPFAQALMRALYVITWGVSHCDHIVSKSCDACSARSPFAALVLVKVGAWVCCAKVWRAD